MKREIEWPTCGTMIKAGKSRQKRTVELKRAAFQEQEQRLPYQPFLRLPLTLAPHRHRHRRCCCAVRTVQCNARKSATVVSCPETRNELREQAAARPKAPSTLTPLTLRTCFQAKWCEWPRMIDSGLEWNRGWHSAASCAKKSCRRFRPPPINE